MELKKKILQGTYVMGHNSLSGGKKTNKKTEWWIVEEFGDASNSDTLIHCRGQECEMEKFSSGVERPSSEEINGTHTSSSRRGDREIMKRQADVCLSTVMNSIWSCFCRHLLAKTQNSLVPLVPRVGRTAEGIWQGMQASNRWETEWPITPRCKNGRVCGMRGGDEVIHSDKWYLSHKLPPARTLYMSRQVSS